MTQPPSPSAAALEVAAAFRKSGAAFKNFIDYRFNKMLTPPAFEVFVRREDEPISDDNPVVVGIFYDRMEAVRERQAQADKQHDEALGKVLDAFAAQAAAAERAKPAASDRETAKLLFYYLLSIFEHGDGGAQNWTERPIARLAAALAERGRAGWDAAIKALEARAAEHRERYDGNAADWAIRYANYLAATRNQTTNDDA